MSDFKIADGTVQRVAYGPYTIATATGLTFVTVPADADLAEIKVFGSGGGGGGRGEGTVAKAGDGGGGGFIHVRNMPVVPGEDLVLVVGVGGDGGVGSTVAGESGDGGAGAGRTHAAKFPSIVTMAGVGGGGGGGGSGGGVETVNAPGGQGGPGGVSTGADGQDASGIGNTHGGGGGTQTAGGSLGIGGNGTSGGVGSSLAGGQGGGDDAGSDGANASGGTPGGGDGGAFDGYAGGGGGGGAGFFGGGGGGRGLIDPSQAGAGGGGGSGFFNPAATLVSSSQGDGINCGGRSDPDYPGGTVGSGGLGGLAVDNGAAGFGGAVFIRFGALETVSTTNDLVIENDAPVMVEGIDLIAQQVRTILLICQGEWFLDLAAGTPWFTRIIGKKFNSGQMNITVREAILSVDGVASIRNIESTRGAERRTANVKVTVLTNQGTEVIVEAQVP